MSTPLLRLRLRDGAFALFALWIASPLVAQVESLGPPVLVDPNPILALTADPTGRFAVIWNQPAFLSGTLQAFDADGKPAGSRFRLVNQDADREIFMQDLAADGTGSYLVTWADRNRFRSETALFARFFDARGRAQTRKIRFVAERGGTQNYSLDTDRNRRGEAVVVWSSREIRNRNWRDFIRFQRFDARGERLLGVRTARVGVSRGDLAGPGVAIDASGRFVVVWSETPPGPGTTGRLFFQRYGRDGARRGKKRLLTRDPAGLFALGGVAAEPAGEFAMVWRRDEGRSQRTVKARWFDPFGRPLTDDVEVSETGDAFSPAMARDRFGNTVFVWGTTSDTSGVFRIRGRVFDRLGEPIGEAFELESFSAGGPFSIDIDDDGTIAVAFGTWRGSSQLSAVQRLRLGCAPGYEQRCP